MGGGRKSKRAKKKKYISKIKFCYRQFAIVVLKPRKNGGLPGWPVNTEYMCGLGLGLR